MIEFPRWCISIWNGSLLLLINVRELKTILQIVYYKVPIGRENEIYLWKGFNFCKKFYLAIDCTTNNKHTIKSILHIKLDQLSRIMYSISRRVMAFTCNVVDLHLSVARSEYDSLLLVLARCISLNESIHRIRELVCICSWLFLM